MWKFLCIVVVFAVLTSQVTAQNSQPNLQTITQDNLSQLQELKSWTSTQDAVLSSDGKVLAVSFRDGTIQLIDTTTFQILSTLTGNGTGFGTLFLNKDASRVLYLDNSGKIYIWKADNQSPLAVNDVPQNLSISPNLDVYAGFYGGEMEIKKFDGGETIASLPASNSVRLTKFSPDGSLFVIVENQAVRVYRTDNWSLIAEFQPNISEPTDASFTPNNQSIAIVGHHLSSDFSAYITTVELWDLGSQQKLTVLEDKGIQYTADFDETRNYMVTSGVDNNIQDVLRVWDLKAQKELFSPGTVTGGGTIGFNEESKIVAIGGGTSPIITLADLQTGHMLRQLTTDGGSQRFQFSSDNTLLLTVSYSEVTRLWSIPAS